MPQLVSIAMKLLHKLVDVREPFHLTLLNVCFTNLQTKPSNRNTISSFFTSAHTSTHPPTHTSTHPPTHNPTHTHSHTSTHSLCDTPYSYTQPEALCETMTRKNNKETSSSSLFFQQTIKATSSVPPVLECSDPNKSTEDSIISVIVPELPPDVDPDVFRALPWHIQSELMSSFQEDSVEQQEHHISSALHTAHADDLITQPSSGTEEPGDVSAEERVPADPDVPDVPPNIDPYVFSQLPPDMQRELYTEWRQSKLRLKMSQKHTARRTTTVREKRPVAKRSNSGSLLQYFKPSSDKRF